MSRTNYIKILIGMVALCGLSFSSWAQNNGSNPYINSKHAYRIPVGHENNTREWYITDKTTDTIQLTDALNYIEIIEATAGNLNEDISIFFDSGTDPELPFVVGNTYYLQYYEFAGGSTNCISARELPITVVQNSFYLQLGTDRFECNLQSDSVRTFNEVNTQTFQSVIVDTVFMNKAANFDVTSWDFDLRVEFDNGEYVLDSIEAVMLTENGGDIFISKLNADGETDSLDFTITADAAVPGSPTPVKLELYLYVTGSVLADEVISLSLHNGRAQTQADAVPTVITEDNIITYPAVDPGDREQDITLNRLPGTHDIVAGSNETAWSAINPSQNSTHNYGVKLFSDANFANDSSGWHIETAGGLMVALANYVLVETPSAASDSSLAQVTFNMGEGDYNLVYIEEDGNGCRTVRHFAFTINPPFDVDVIVGNDVCPYYSNRVNTYNTATSTVVADTVRLNRDNYDSNWEFSFAYTSTPAFNAADVVIASVNITGTNGGATSFNLGTNTGTVKVNNSTVDPHKEVIIEVTYDGLYQAEHNIQIELSNITGSFNESDEDGTGDKDTHIIYKLPQPENIAGID